MASNLASKDEAYNTVSYESLITRIYSDVKTNLYYNINNRVHDLAQKTVQKPALAALEDTITQKLNKKADISELKGLTQAGDHVDKVSLDLHKAHVESQLKEKVDKADLISLLEQLTAKLRGKTEGFDSSSLNNQPSHQQDLKLAKNGTTADENPNLGAVGLARIEKIEASLMEFSLAAIQIQQLREQHSQLTAEHNNNADASRLDRLEGSLNQLLACFARQEANVQSLPSALGHQQSQTGNIGSLTVKHNQIHASTKDRAPALGGPLGDKVVYDRDSDDTCRPERSQAGTSRSKYEDPLKRAQHVFEEPKKIHVELSNASLLAFPGMQESNDILEEQATSQIAPRSSKLPGSLQVIGHVMSKKRSRDPATTNDTDGTGGSGEDPPAPNKKKQILFWGN